MEGTPLRGAGRGDDGADDAGAGVFVLEAVFSSKISLSKLHYLHITSNLLPRAWSIKCR